MQQSKATSLRIELFILTAGKCLILRAYSTCITEWKVDASLVTEGWMDGIVGGRCWKRLHGTVGIVDETTVVMLQYLISELNLWTTIIETLIMKMEHQQFTSTVCSLHRLCDFSFWTAGLLCHWSDLSDILLNLLTVALVSALKLAFYM